MPNRPPKTIATHLKVADFKIVLIVRAIISHPTGPPQGSRTPQAGGYYISREKLQFRSELRRFRYTTTGTEGVG